MRCWLCREEFRHGDLIIPLLSYSIVDGEEPKNSNSYIHATHQEDQ